MKEIRILHVLASKSFGGAENIVMQICENLDNKIFKFFIICNGGVLKEKFEKKGFCVFHQNANCPSIKNLKELKNIIQKYNINIIHAHDNKASIYSVICKKLYRLDITILSHVHSNYPWLKQFSVFRLIDRFFRNSYDKSIFCGNKVLEHYEKYGKIDKDKAIVIQNSINISKIEVNKKSKSIRDDLKISENDFVCCFAGRLTIPKGLIPFLEKLSLQKEVLEKVKFVIIGDGILENQIKKLIELKNMENRVILIGYKENILDYISEFETLILPSIYEGLPIVLLEAMSQGKPVIAFDTGGIEEILQDNIVGFLIKQFDYNDMFNKILLLQKNKNLREILGKNGLDQFQKYFNITVFAEKMESIYKSMNSQVL